MNRCGLIIDSGKLKKESVIEAKAIKMQKEKQVSRCIQDKPQCSDGENAFIRSSLASVALQENQPGDATPEDSLDFPASRSFSTVPWAP
jgi:hypothetical protein